MPKDEYMATEEQTLINLSSMSLLRDYIGHITINTCYIKHNQQDK